MTVIVDHDTGVLLWARPGRDSTTLEKFFDSLGVQRCAQITLVSADAAEWIATVVAARCKNAELCLDPFHIVAWATKALDEVRREVWNAARKGGQSTVAKELKNARFALWKNPGDLTERQACTLAGIAKTNAPLYRAYLLKEQLRQVFQLKGAEGIALLDAWLKWAWRCRLPAFVKLARSIRDHRAGIDAALSHGTVECPGGEREYETAAPDPHRLRVPLTRGPRRSRHARPRRHVPTLTRPRDHLIMPTDPAQEPSFGTVRRLRAQPSPTPPQYRPGCSTPTACANTPMPHDDANTSPLTRPTPTQRAPTRQSRRSAYAPTSPSPATRSAGCAPTTTNSATGYACNSVPRSTGPTGPS